jgi:hypothetical protein
MSSPDAQTAKRKWRIFAVAGFAAILFVGLGALSLYVHLGQPNGWRLSLVAPGAPIAGTFGPIPVVASNDLRADGYECEYLSTSGQTKGVAFLQYDEITVRIRIKPLKDADDQGFAYSLVGDQGAVVSEGRLAPLRSDGNGAWVFQIQDTNLIVAKEIVVRKK